jgi:hypothetical protein
MPTMGPRGSQGRVAAAPQRWRRRESGYMPGLVPSATSDCRRGRLKSSNIMMFFTDDERERQSTYPMSSLGRSWHFVHDRARAQLACCPLVTLSTGQFPNRRGDGQPG